MQATESKREVEIQFALPLPEVNRLSKVEALYLPGKRALFLYITIPLTLAASAIALATASLS